MTQPLPAKYPEDGPLKLVVGDFREIEVTFPDTYSVDFTTGHTFLSQVRASRNRASTLIATFAVTATAARVLKLTLTKVEADKLQDGLGTTASQADAWWDLQVTTTATTAPRTWLGNRTVIVGDGSNV